MKLYLFWKKRYPMAVEYKGLKIREKKQIWESAALWVKGEIMFVDEITHRDYKEEQKQLTAKTTQEVD